MSTLPRGWTFKKELQRMPDGSVQICAMATYQAVNITTMAQLNAVLEKHFKWNDGAAAIRAEFESQQRIAQNMTQKTPRVQPPPVAAPKAVVTAAGPKRKASAAPTAPAAAKKQKVQTEIKAASSTSSAPGSAKSISALPKKETKKPVPKTESAASIAAVTKKSGGGVRKPPPVAAPKAVVASSKAASSKGPNKQKRPITQPSQFAAPRVAEATDLGNASSAVPSSAMAVEAGPIDEVKAADSSSLRSHRGSIFSYPTPTELRFFRRVYCPIADPFASSRDGLLHKHYADTQFIDWLALLDLNQSLYLHGIGNKEKLLKGFVANCLAGEDVLEVACGLDKTHPACGGNRQQSWHTVIMHLLRTIVDSILMSPLPSASSAMPPVGAAAGSCTLGTTRGAARGVVGAPALGKVDFSHGAISTLLQDEDLSVIHKTEIVAEALMIYHGYGARGSTGKPHQISSSDGADSRGGEQDGTASVTVMSYNRPSKLYIVIVDSLSGQTTSTGSAASRHKSREEKSQAMRCLSLLASCRAVGVIASVSNINTLCNGCDVDTLNLFNWAYIHCPTFEPKGTELTLQDFGINFASYTVQHKEILLGEDGNAVDSSTATSLKFVINSLTRKHREILHVLCSYVLEEEKKKKASGSMSASAVLMPWTLFVKSCIDNLIVRGDPDMRYLMRELIDHRLVAMPVDPEDGIKTVSLSYPASVLFSLLQ